MMWDWQKTSLTKNLKDTDPVYRKQFKIPEAHHQFIKQTLEEWLKLVVVKKSNPLLNAPIFCIQKKTWPTSQNCLRPPRTQPKFTR